MQKRFFIAPAAMVAFILFFTVFGDRGLLMISRLHRDRDEVQQKLAELKGENEKLKREIAALQSDRRYLESIARRDFGLVRSNETIYQFPAPEKAPPKTQQQAAHPGQQGVEQAAAKGLPPAQQNPPQAEHGATGKTAPKGEQKPAPPKR